MEISTEITKIMFAAVWLVLIYGKDQLS